jgi:hypothetical protein
VGTPPLDYCREIETYLCRKNDGHLIRVVGPSFDLVAAWAARGVPLKIACAGIDRAFERYYRKGPRRRPLKIDFCEADVLDVFDEWRRAIGLASGPDGGESGDDRGRRKGPSLPAHLARVVTRLSEARARGTLDERFDDLIDRISGELDRARSERGGMRGEQRRALTERLEALDAELVGLGRSTLDGDAIREIERDAAVALAEFRGRMSSEAFERASEASRTRLLRERLGLPTVSV